MLQDGLMDPSTHIRPIRAALTLRGTDSAMLLSRTQDLTSQQHHWSTFSKTSLLDKLRYTTEPPADMLTWHTTILAVPAHHLLIWPFICKRLIWQLRSSHVSSRPCSIHFFQRRPLLKRHLTALPKASASATCAPTSGSTIPKTQSKNANTTASSKRRSSEYLTTFHSKGDMESPIPTTVTHRSALRRLTVNQHVKTFNGKTILTDWTHVFSVTNAILDQSSRSSPEEQEETQVLSVQSRDQLNNNLLLITSMEFEKYR